MANQNPEAADESKSLLDHVTDVMGTISVSTKPLVITGVQRKINIGDFENIDVYCGVVLPVDIDDEVDTDTLVSVLEGYIEVGFHVTSTETLKRYQVVKGAKAQK